MLRERRRHANFKPNRRLDRKSSRGMIYENEELRLRTININAEVERGQSDIRKLRRENEQLRREIWSLRDEYDRLNKLLRANRSTESCGGGGGGICEAENNGNNSGTQGEESDSCDTCKDDDEDEDIICDEMHCNLHNRSKCNQNDHDFHQQQQQQQHCNQPSSSSCSSESKKKNVSSPLPTTSSPLSSLSNNGSKEITENYDNSQKSILDNNSSGSSNYKNCSNTNCSSPAGRSSKIYNTKTSSLTNIGLDRDSSSRPGSIPAFVPGANADVDVNNDRNNPISSRTNIISSEDCTGGSDKLRENLHVNFDHLSIVSEENLTNSDGNSVQQNDIDPLSLTSGVIGILNMHEPTISAIAGSAGTAKTLAITNNKQVNRISDIESLVPPLSHFENISYENIGPNLADLEDVNYSTSTTTTGDTVIAASGWNFSAPATAPVKSKSLTSTTTSTGVQTLDDISSSSSSSIINQHNQKLISTEMAISSSLKIAQHLLDTDSSSLSAIDSKSPKHFFSPLKPRLNVDLKHSLSTPSSPLIINAFEKQHHKQNSEKYVNYNGPDIFVANALASSSSSPYHTQIMKQQKNCRRNNTEPIYASVQKPLSSSLKMYGESSFQTGGNLEDLLMDIETLSKDILQMQLKKQKSLSEDKLDGGGNDEEENLLNRKPFRSEMNLVLTYNGTNPVITPIMKSTTSTSLNCGIGKDDYYGSTCDKDFSAATTMEKRSTRGTPPLPNVPEPMTLFPENRPYLGFENFGQPSITSLAGGKPIMSIFKAQNKKSSTSETSDILSSPIIDSLTNIDTNVTTTTVIDKTTSNIPNHNEENSVKTAEAVKGSKQLLLDKKKNKTTGSFASETTNCDSSSGSESTVKRKSRRVSILFKKSEDSSKDAKRGSEKCQNESKSETIPMTELTSDHQTSDITNATTMTKLSAFSNETQANFIDDEKNIQDSPHSERHKSNSSLTSGCHHHHHHHGHGHSHHHHNQNRKMSQDSGTGKHLSKLPVTPGDGDSDNAVTISGYIQDQQQKSLNSHRTTKCGRRHSEGTVLATMAEGSGSNDGGNGGGSDTSGGGGNDRRIHQHHHSHSGISGHRAGVVGGASGGVSTSGHQHHHHHHHHHARHDSYNDGVGGTSFSEHNSNSLASSRESSTSLSTRSQRRKISISSHSGGKIPWCACWGNGCL